MDERLRLEDRSRRNRNFKVVRADGTGLLVKQGADEHARGTVRVEARLLAAIRRNPSLARVRWLAPEHVASDEGLLVTRLVHPATSTTMAARSAREMWVIYLEMGVALALLALIVWFTWPRKK